jgi:hypothetical protein
MQYQFRLLESASPDDTELQLAFTWPLFFSAGMALTFPSGVEVLVSESALTQTMPFVLPCVALLGSIAANAIGSIEVDDVGRICKYLAIDSTYEDILEQHINSVEARRPGKQRQAAAYLAELDSLEALAVEQGTDENTGLVKAGPLEWSLGGKTVGSKSRQSDLRKMLITVLNAQRFVPQQIGNCTPVISGHR